MEFAQIWVILKAESCWAALILYRIGNTNTINDTEPLSLSYRRAVIFGSVATLKISYLLGYSLATALMLSKSQEISLYCSRVAFEQRYVFLFQDQPTNYNVNHASNGTWNNILLRVPSFWQQQTSPGQVAISAISNTRKIIFPIFLWLNNDMYRDRLKGGP